MGNRKKIKRLQRGLTETNRGVDSVDHKIAGLEKAFKTIEGATRKCLRQLGAEPTDHYGSAVVPVAKEIEKLKDRIAQLEAKVRQQTQEDSPMNECCQPHSLEPVAFPEPNKIRERLTELESLMSGLLAKDKAHRASVSREQINLNDKLAQTGREFNRRLLQLEEDTTQLRGSCSALPASIAATVEKNEEEIEALKAKVDYKPTGDLDLATCYSYEIEARFEKNEETVKILQDHFNRALEMVNKNTGKKSCTCPRAEIITGVINGKRQSQLVTICIEGKASTDESLKQALQEVLTDIDPSAR